VRARVARAAAGPGQRTRGEMRACTTRQRPPTTPFGADSDDGRTSRRGRRTRRRNKSRFVSVVRSNARSIARSLAHRSFRRSGRGARVRRPRERRHDNANGTIKTRRRRPAIVAKRTLPRPSPPSPAEAMEI